VKSYINQTLWIFLASQNQQALISQPIMSIIGFGARLISAQQVNMDAVNDLQLLREKVAAFCAEAGYFLSPEADNILRDIVRIKETTGDYYCPCQPQRLPETVCVCQPVRNGLVDVLGSCFCNLILARKA